MKPTYRLIPKPNLPPSEIQLGSLIAQHKEPDNAFYIAEPWMYEKRATNPKPFSINVSHSESGSFGIMASFVGMLPISGGVERSHQKDAGRWLSSSNMVEESMTVTDAFLDSLSRNAYVVNHFEEHGTKDVWVVSGIKVGWNVSVTDTEMKGNELGVSLDAEAAVLSLGPTGHSSRSRKIQVHYFAEGPVVFGYELTRLCVRMDGSVKARKEQGEFYNEDVDNPEGILRMTVSDTGDILGGIQEGYDELAQETIKVLVY